LTGFADETGKILPVAGICKTDMGASFFVVKRDSNSTRPVVEAIQLLQIHNLRSKGHDNEREAAF